MNTSLSSSPMNSSSSSCSDSFSTWYNNSQAERPQQQSGSSRCSLGGTEGRGSRSRSSSLGHQGKLSSFLEQDYSSFRRQTPSADHDRTSSTMLAAVDNDMCQLPTDKDLTKSRVHKQRQLQKRASRERARHKQTLRGRLKRMRGNSKRKKLADSSNNEHDGDDDDDDDESNSQSDHDKNSRGDDEETGDGGDAETATSRDDSDSKYRENSGNENYKRNDSSWSIGSLFSITPYKPINVMDQSLSAEKPPPDPSCCRRYLSERNPCYDWYMIQDTLLGNKRFDLQETFCPTTRCAQVVKAASSSLVVCAFLFSIMQFDGPFLSGYLKYYEHIGLLLSTLYMMLSMMNSLIGVRQPWLNITAVQGRVRWSWMLFIVASHIECIMSVVYWSLLYEPGVTRISFLIVMKYGGVACQVLLDGLYINRIPLRWMFFWGLLWLIDILYIFYSVLYTFYLTTRGDDESSSVVIPVPGQQLVQSPTTPPATETALYPFLDWKGDWQYALIFSVIFVCALSPAVHLFLWLSSLYRWPFCLCCRQEYRRYFVGRKKDDKKKLKTREERRLEREELTLRKQREREEAANAVAADMVHQDNLQKHFSKNRSNNSNNRYGDNQSVCDTTANESTTCGWNDSCSTVASGGGAGAGAGSCNDNGSYQVSSAARGNGISGDSSCSSGQEEVVDEGEGEEEYDASSPPLWQSHFTMGDIDEEGEEESTTTTTTTRRLEDLFVDDEAVPDSKQPVAFGRRPVGRF